MLPSSKRSFSVSRCTSKHFVYVALCVFGEASTRLFEWPHPLLGSLSPKSTGSHPYDGDISFFPSVRGEQRLALATNTGRTKCSAFKSRLRQAVPSLRVASVYKLWYIPVLTGSPQHKIPIPPHPRLTHFFLPTHPPCSLLGCPSSSSFTGLWALGRRLPALSREVVSKFKANNKEKNMNPLLILR